MTDTLTPSERAISSPRFNIFSSLDRMMEIITAMLIQIAGKNRPFIVSPVREPTIKDVILMVISVSSNFNVLIPEFKNVETVMPARIIVVRELSAK